MLSSKVNFNLTKYSKILVQSKKFLSSNVENIVYFEEINNKGIITLNRPKVLNVINLSMIRSIKDQLQKWESNKEFVIIKGVGEKSFCAGGDIRAVLKDGLCENTITYFKLEYEMHNVIGTYKIPYIALIDGITMGGGAGVAGITAYGKYVIATERTMFAIPETAIGSFPDVGGSQFLSKFSGKLGYYLALTGYRLRGKDVLKCGIASHFIQSARLPKLEMELLKTKNTNEIDSVLKELCPTDNNDFVLAKHLDKINKTFSGKTVEDIINNLKIDDSDWAKETLEVLNKMSPTSLKVTHHQLELASGMTLQECLVMQHRLNVHSIEATELKEGIRALLIDKDKNPKWNPKTLEKVTEDRIQFYFKKLSEKDELKL